MKNNYRLPSDYNSRHDYQKYVDGHDSLNSTIYQPLVYQSAFQIVKKTNAKYLIDIGCGDGSKVAEVRLFSPECKVIMIDHEFIIKNVSKKYDFAEYICADFDVEIPFIDEDKLKDSVIICSDVIEHLLKPEILIEFFSRCKGIVKAIVISTPDRAEERGVFDYGPPANPYHVREWTLDEFTRMLMDYGFTNRMLAGLTISNDFNNVKATLFCLITKYFEYEPKLKANVKYLVCEKDIFQSNLKKIKRIINVADIEHDAWYVLDVIDAVFMPLILRISVEEQISLAEANGFNILMKTSLESNIRIEDGIKAGDTRMRVNKFEEPIAAIRGDLLKDLLLGRKTNVKNYPFNVLSIKKIPNPSFFYFKSNFKMLNLGRWHENITRKNFIIELAFGGIVK